SRNSADGHQRLPGKLPCPADALEPDNRIRPFLAAGGEHRPDSQVVGGGLVCLPQLVGTVRRNREPQLWTNHSASALRRKILLPDVQAIEPSRQAKVGAIIHDQPNFVAQPSPQLAPLLQLDSY